ncbi:protein of unknown function [Magnetospirillum sp. XM-1]|nr:protein of unknown function [Magnetospirillum sp. XM-1]
MGASSFGASAKRASISWALKLSVCTIRMKPPEARHLRTLGSTRLSVNGLPDRLMSATGVRHSGARPLNEHGKS